MWLAVFLLMSLALIRRSFFSTWVGEWIFFFWGGKELGCVFIWDFYSFLFMSAVILISCIIFVYSFYYIDSEKRRLGFTILLFFFVLSIFCLIMSPNLAFLLLGWDGLGLTSYLLVVYYRRGSSSVAGIVTFLTNRLGDIFFLLSIAFISFIYDWDSVGFRKNIFVLSFLLITAFMTKRAQVPFSSWLPAAMAAPTPVSSLVHSSTLVTAGIFLLIRFKSVLTGVTIFLTLFGVITLLLAGVMANYEWDLKKLIAFSTLSQLGFMVTSYSMGLVLLRFFHLITHALFKASLFMSAGAVIHRGDNSQEFRNTFNFLFTKPLISRAVLVCLFCLRGVPFTRGFFSKDLILDGSFISFAVYMFFLVGVGLTIAYSFRFFLYSFKYRSSTRNSIVMVYENSQHLIFPIWVLVFFALTGGFFIRETGVIPISFLWGRVGWKAFYISYVFFIFCVFAKIREINRELSFKKFFFRTMWFLNKVVRSRITFVALTISRAITRILDMGFQEHLGPQGAYIGFSRVGQKIFRSQSFIFVSLFFSFVFLYLSI